MRTRVNDGMGVDMDEGLRSDEMAVAMGDSRDSAAPASSASVPTSELLLKIVPCYGAKQCRKHGIEFNRSEWEELIQDAVGEAWLTFQNRLTECRKAGEMGTWDRVREARKAAAAGFWRVWNSRFGENRDSTPEVCVAVESGAPVWRRVDRVGRRRKPRVIRREGNGDDSYARLRECQGKAVRMKDASGKAMLLAMLAARPEGITKERATAVLGVGTRRIEQLMDEAAIAVHVQGDKLNTYQVLADALEEAARPEEQAPIRVIPRPIAAEPVRFADSGFAPMCGNAYQERDTAGVNEDQGFTDPYAVRFVGPKRYTRDDILALVETKSIDVAEAMTLLDSQ